MLNGLVVVPAIQMVLYQYIVWIHVYRYVQVDLGTDSTSSSPHLSLIPFPASDEAPISIPASRYKLWLVGHIRYGGVLD